MTTTKGGKTMVSKHRTMLKSRMHFSQYQTWFKSVLTTSSCAKLRNFYYFTGTTSSSQRDKQFGDNVFNRNNNNLIQIGKYHK